MTPLSKSRLLAYRQCPKRLWLEIYHPWLGKHSSATQALFASGHQVGEIARQIHDPGGNGTLINLAASGIPAAITQTQSLLAANPPQPIFEAGFIHDNVRAFADVLLPTVQNGQPGWRMVEVKSSTQVKDYHRDDAAIQAYVARGSGLNLTAIAVACIDSKWTYPGDGNYQGLLTETDLTTEAFSRTAEVTAWINGAQAVLAGKIPSIPTGKHCTEPYSCGFMAYCKSLEPQATAPVQWLPGKLRKALQAQVDSKAVIDMSQAPDALLNDSQQRVKHCTLNDAVHFDQAGAAQALAAATQHIQTDLLPACFLDFETIMFAVPIWAGTRPYQQIPFQFSAHRLSGPNCLQHEAFLDLSGNDPSRGFAEALIQACGSSGPIFVYNQGFEKTRIEELARRFAGLAPALRALNERVVDLLPIAKQYFYHPSQQGSWSIKAVLPALCPDLDYRQLSGVQDGGMATAAFLEAIAPATTPQRKKAIRAQLLAYCQLDTYAMVRLWAEFVALPA